MGMSWIELLKELLNDFYKLEMWVWEKFIKPSLIMALWLFGLSAVLGILCTNPFELCLSPFDATEGRATEQ